MIGVHRHAADNDGVSVVSQERLIGFDSFGSELGNAC